jgi:hypothetical protein
MVLGALVMLLGYARWLDTSPDGATANDRDKQFLPHLLEQSRKYQNNVSTALAGAGARRPLGAPPGLSRRAHASDEPTPARLDRHGPPRIYGGLLTVLLRLIFLLYAEDRDQLPATGLLP